MKQALLADPYEVLTDPDLMNKVVNHITMGGSLIDLAEVLQIRYSDLIKFIRSNKVNSDIYDQALADRDEWAREKILKEIREIGFFDIRKILNPDGTVMPVDQWPSEVAKAVSGVDISEIHGGREEGGMVIGNLKKIKMVDKLKALEMAAKNLSLLTEKHEVKGKITLDQLIMATQTHKKEEDSHG